MARRLNNEQVKQLKNQLETYLKQGITLTFVREAYSELVAGDSRSAMKQLYSHLADVRKLDADMADFVDGFMNRNHLTYS